MSAHPLSVTIHDVPSPKATVVALHGIGLGPWLWEPWAPLFRAEALRLHACALPGHGDGADAGLDDMVAAVEAHLDTVEGPVVLVGHSLGGLVAQLVAARRHEDRPLHALALVCPLVPGNVQLVPDPRALAALARSGWSVAADAVGGRPLSVPWSLYRSVGLDVLPEADARAVFDRTLPWPARVVRDLVRRPEVDPVAIACPVLVAIGRRDRVVPWVRARVLGDLYEGIVWRYDDLGHFPTYEPNGARMGRDLAAWCAEPRRPQVLESEGFGPAEGVGHLLRRRRRGEMMKKRSAYGQKKSAR
jgi:pimeloyl-ACP methyl ester carboxylesterase